MIPDDRLFDGYASCYNVNSISLIFHAMNIYQLSLSAPVIDPHWLYAAHQGRLPVQDNAVTLAGVTLPIAGKRPTPENLLEAAQGLALQPATLADGTMVEVWCDRNGYYVCALAEDFDRKQADEKAQAEAEQQARDEKQRQRQAAAIAFNKALPIPAEWAPGHKDVLSGLSEHSDGSGLNARSVVHVLLKAPLVDGRFKRNKGDLLCTSAAGTNGKQWSNQTEAPPYAQVSCKACLKQAQRWAKAGPA